MKEVAAAAGRGRRGSGATAQASERCETPCSGKSISRYAAYRPVIAALIQALCAVPKGARKEYADELMKADDGADDISPDEFVVRMVLINLNVAERVANAQREELKPKLYPIVGRGIGGRRGGRAGSTAEPSGQRDADEAPRPA